MALPIITLERADVLEDDRGGSGPLMTFRINLSQATDEDVTLEYRILPGTAVSADLWQQNPYLTYSITIKAGDTSGFITFRVNGDDLDEVDEALSLEVFNPTNAVLSGGEKTLTTMGIIRDDDGTGANLSLFVSDAAVTEGNSGQKTATFQIQLSQPATKDLSFAYTTVDGSAKAGSDYVAKTGTVLFKAGQTLATVTVLVNGDTGAEKSEFFSLVLTPTADIKNGTAASTGIATIFDNDTAKGLLPVVSIERSDVVEDNSGGSGPYVTFRIDLSKVSDEDITLSYRILPGTAVSADFWQQNPYLTKSITIKAGDTSGFITLHINGDSLDEVDEAFSLELFNPVNAVLSGGETTLTSVGVIRDNDGTGANLSLFVSDAVVTEGNSGQKIATFEVHLSQPAAKALSFAYKTIDGSAKAGSDYVAKAGTLVFKAGQTVATVEVLVNGDAVAKKSEFFSLSLTPTADIKNGTAASTGVATILDDDTGKNVLPIISIERADVVEDNSGGSGPYVTFRVNLSKASDDDITLDYRILPGTAVSADLWQQNPYLPYSITIKAGDTSGFITLHVNGDSLDEVDESLWLEAFNPTNAVLSGGEKTLTSLAVIRDNDGGGSNLSLFVADAVVTEGNSGQRVATFEIHLSQPAAKDLSFAYKTIDGSAKAGSDYVAKSGTVVFKAGQTVATVEVLVNGDAAVEKSEFFSLSLTPTADIKNGTAASTGLATILDDDTGKGAAPIISIERADVVEDNSGGSGPYMTFRVNLSKASADDVTLSYRILPGTAQAADLWQQSIGVEFSLTIKAGDTSGFITLHVNGDSLDEVDESLWLEVFKPVNAVLSGAERTLTSLGVIRDNDGGGSNLSLFVSNTGVTEGNSGQRVATFEVHLSQPAAKDFSFAYKTVDGSAKAGSDYIAKTGAVTFKAGQTVATVEVLVKGDQVLEGNETFSLVLTPTADIKNGKLGSTGVATLYNDDTIHEVIYGTAGADVLSGKDGNDRIFGLAGADTLNGDDGDDVLVGGAGGDKLFGGAGVDTASYSDATKGVRASLLSPSSNTGDALGDSYSSIERLSGSKFSDILTGNAGNNILTGGVGADSLQGAGGADRFVFNALADSTVATSGRDTIFDFSSNDRIDLRAIDANTKVSADQAFSFIGTAAFANKAGELRYVKGASDTYIYGDVNGDGKADFAIHLDDAIVMTSGYFYL